MDYFRTSGFRYSLRRQASKQPIDLKQFLFKDRVGFCEHYAAAFSSLMRAAGIPSRVVVGFLGGTFNPYGQFWSLSLKEAHAWSEVWIEGQWRRVDPTSIFSGFHQQEILFPALRQIEFLWEAIRFGAQEFLAKKLAFLVGTIILILTVWCFFIVVNQREAVLKKLCFRRRKRPEDAFEKAFRRLCRILETRVASRLVQEGYEEYRLKVLNALGPDLVSQKTLISINEVFHSYLTLRYGSKMVRSELIRECTLSANLVIKDLSKLNASRSK
jgi:hypothetical protein